MQSLRSRKTRSSKNSLAVGLLFASVLAGSIVYAAASEHLRLFAAQTPISVSSELVVVPVNVTDSKGNFVPGLTQSDFQIHEDGVAQNIALFEDEDTPVSIGLLVDHSGSMATKLPGVISAVTAFAKMSDARDEMFVLDFNDFVSVEQASGNLFMTDASEVQKAIQAVSADGRTALYDAIYEGLHRLHSARWQKRALVIVSDGGDDASRHTFAEVLALASQSQVTIYSIGLVDDSSDEQNPKILKRLSAETGGVAFFPDSHANVNDIALRIAGNLREQYTLAYVPHGHQTEPAYHKIEVRVARKGKLRVRTRMGYSAAIQTAQSIRFQERRP